MKKRYIYRIVSPTNRIYIGKTFNLKRRIESYKGLFCKGQRILFNSLSKHGWDKHIFEILFEDYCTNEYLSELEVNYIFKYNSFKECNPEFGMNLTLGGEGVIGLKHTEETKKMISETKKNSKRTENEILGSEKRRGQKVNKSDEWIKNNSESIKKPILQYDLNGVFIKEWKSAKDVQTELGFCRKNLSANLRGITNKAYDFIWIYKNQEYKIDEILHKINKKRHAVKVIDVVNGKIYESIIEASEINKISYISLFNMLSGKIKNKTNLVKYETS